MTKLRLLLDKLGISLTPLQSYVVARWGPRMPSPLVQSDDPQSYVDFVASIFIHDDTATKTLDFVCGDPLASYRSSDGVGSQLPDLDVVVINFEKKSSTSRLVDEVANHLMSKRGSTEDNVLVSGFGHRWVFDGSGNVNRKNDNVDLGPNTQNGRGNQVSARPGMGGAPGSLFKLETGTGKESLQYYCTANWKLLHSRLGDDVLFRLLATKMIFASCG